VEDEDVEKPTSSRPSRAAKEKNQDRIKKLFKEEEYFEEEEEEEDFEEEDDEEEEEEEEEGDWKAKSKKSNQKQVVATKPPKGQQTLTSMVSRTNGPRSKEEQKKFEKSFGSSTSARSKGAGTSAPPTTELRRAALGLRKKQTVSYAEPDEFDFIDEDTRTSKKVAPRTKPSTSKSNISKGS